MVVVAVQWCIPDVPSILKDQIKREAYLTNEMIIQHEKDRAKLCKCSFHSVCVYKRLCPDSMLA